MMNISGRYFIVLLCLYFARKHQTDGKLFFILAKINSKENVLLSFIPI